MQQVEQPVFDQRRDDRSRKLAAFFDLVCAGVTVSGAPISAEQRKFPWSTKKSLQKPPFGPVSNAGKLLR
ncbi:MAG: hypothetical protein JO358_23320 [Alphaproteobacteria bacterium]|nr:hypothetical protein [Alphaproteobacteria bacterium]